MLSIIKLGGSLLDNKSIEFNYGQWIFDRMPRGNFNTESTFSIPLLILLYNKSSIGMCKYLQEHWDSIDALSGKNIDIITYHPDELTQELETSISDQLNEIDKRGGDPTPFLLVVDLTIRHLPADLIQRPVPPYAHEFDVWIDPESLHYIPIRGESDIDIGTELFKLIDSTADLTHNLRGKRKRMSGAWETSANASTIAKRWHAVLLRKHVAAPFISWVLSRLQQRFI